jgi:hypothetical protein
VTAAAQALSNKTNRDRGGGGVAAYQLGKQRVQLVRATALYFSRNVRRIEQEEHCEAQQRCLQAMQVAASSTWQNLQGVQVIAL